MTTKIYKRKFPTISRPIWRGETARVLQIYRDGARVAMYSLANGKLAFPPTTSTGYVCSCFSDSKVRSTILGKLPLNAKLSKYPTLECPFALYKTTLTSYVPSGTCEPPSYVMFSTSFHPPVSSTSSAQPSPFLLLCIISVLDPDAAGTFR